VPKIPFLHPNSPKLSEARDALREIEHSGVLSNYGPVNTRLEREILESMFDGRGACLTVCNATTGLMMAIKHCTGEARAPRRYALMPSFTFAAPAHAAIWCGLTPLFCDIDPHDWAASEAAERELLDRYGEEVAVVVPYATFGNCIDLKRYEKLAAEYGVAVVIDAAASLGSICEDGFGFGTGCPFPIVYSMHATKAFATTEAGLIYCTDVDAVNELRAMANFGFAGKRVAMMPGLNGKLNEITALMALLKLKELASSVEHRTKIATLYSKELPELTFQQVSGRRHAFMFVSVLLPAELAGPRPEVLRRLAADGVEARTYFSPHVAEQPYFHGRSLSGDLTVTNDVACRILSLPLSDFITEEQVHIVCAALRNALA